MSRFAGATRDLRHRRKIGSSCTPPRSSSSAWGENATSGKAIGVAGGQTLVLPFRGAVDVVEVVASGAFTPVTIQEL